MQATSCDRFSMHMTFFPLVLSPLEEHGIATKQNINKIRIQAIQGTVADRAMIDKGMSRECPIGLYLHVQGLAVFTFY